MFSTQYVPLSPIPTSRVPKPDPSAAQSYGYRDYSYRSNPYIQRPVITYLYILVPLLLIIIVPFSLAFYLDRQGEVPAPQWLSSFSVRSPRTMTQIITIFASSLTAATRWALGCAAALLARKRILNHSRPISDIEIFSSIKNISIFWSWRSQKAAMLFTWFLVALCGLLTSGFVGLIFPFPIPVTTELSGGSEIDFSIDSDLCTTWLGDVRDRIMQTLVTSCSEDLSYHGFTYSSCMYTSQMHDIIFAAKASILLYFASRLPVKQHPNFVSSFTTLNNTRILGSTAGTLPTGPAGIQVFDFPRKPQRTSNFNYTLQLQGFWFDVSCQYNSQSFLNVTWAPWHETSYLITPTCPDGSVIPSGPTVVLYPSSAQNGLLVAGQCKVDNKDVLLLRSFNRPFNSANNALDFMQCGYTPMLGDVDMVFDSELGAFRAFKKSRAVVKSSSLIGLAVTVQGSAVVAGAQTVLAGNVLEVQMQTLAAAYGGVSWNVRSSLATDLMATTLQGMMEFQASFVRLTVTAFALSNPDLTPPSECLREVKGVMVERLIGWSIKQSTILGLLPLLIISVVGLIMVLWASNMEGTPTRFDPTSPASLIAATAVGRVAFRRRDGVGIVGDPMDEMVLRTRVSYGPHGENWGLESE